MVYDTLPNENLNQLTSDVMHMKMSILSDAAIGKSAEIRDGLQLSVRPSASNVLNHFNLQTARFSSDAWSPGQTTQSDQQPRNVNVQFRLIF